jgi:uncharacterized protein (TIGR00730 family)
MTDYDILDREEIRDLIARLISLAGKSPDTDLIMETITTALKLVTDHTERGDLKVINTALKEMRYASKVFAPYRNVRKVTLFGSSRTEEWEPGYLQAVTFAREITQVGYMVITGAGEGIMKGGQAGAGREKSFGMNIRLPFEQVPNVYIQNDAKLITFKYFFTRKLAFIKETHALALFPGGFGTHDEGFETLTLLQTGKSTPLPVVLLDVPGGHFWNAWKDYIEKQLLGRRMVSPEDMHLFKVTDQVDEAVREIVTFYSNYHSMRYVGEQMVLRVQHPVTEELLENLNHRFSDILLRESIRSTAPLPEEANEPELSHLPRLVCHFNRRNYGRLRQMIDLINQSGPYKVAPLL